MGGDCVKNPADMYFIVDSMCIGPFIDLIYFYHRNSADQMLKEEYQVNW